MGIYKVAVSLLTLEVLELRRHRWNVGVQVANCFDGNVNLLGVANRHDASGLCRLWSVMPKERTGDDTNPTRKTKERLNRKSLWEEGVCVCIRTRERFHWSFRVYGEVITRGDLVVVSHKIEVTHLIDQSSRPLPQAFPLSVEQIFEVEFLTNESNCIHSSNKFVSLFILCLFWITESQPLPSNIILFRVFSTQSISNRVKFFQDLIFYRSRNIIPPVRKIITYRLSLN